MEMLAMVTEATKHHQFLRPAKQLTKIIHLEREQLGILQSNTKGKAPCLQHGGYITIDSKMIHNSYGNGHHGNNEFAPKPIANSSERRLVT